MATTRAPNALAHRVDPLGQPLSVSQNHVFEIFWGEPPLRGRVPKHAKSSCAREKGLYWFSKGQGVFDLRKVEIDFFAVFSNK